MTEKQGWMWIWVGLLLWGVVGCGSPQGSPETLINSVLSDPKTFNTYLAEEASSRDVISYTLGGLTEIGGQSLLPEPSLATSWQVSDDGLRYVFTLREELRWSDGEPLTAADVDFTFNQIIYNEKIPTSSRDVQRIGGLPAGISLNPQTGSLTGIPTVAGTFHFTLQVTDSKNQTGSRDYAIAISDQPVSAQSNSAQSNSARFSEPPAPFPSSEDQISSGSLEILTTLPGGLLGKPYQQGLTATGGDPPYTWSDSGSLPRVRMLNPQQVEFLLPEPFTPFLIQAGAAILPKHVFQKAIETLDDQGNPLFLKSWTINTPVKEIISAGPYLIDSYVQGERVVYKANPYYWKKGSKGESLPKIPRMVLRIVDSQDTALLQFRSQEVDIYTVRGSDFPLLKREEKRDHFKIYNLGSTLNNNFLAFNLNQGLDPATNKPFVDPIKSRWFNDLAFRRAVALGIDRQALVDSVLRGLGQIQNSPISPSNPFSLSPEQGLPQYPYDPEQAKRLLIKAGYQYNDQQQLQDSDGNPVRFTINTNAGNNEREATGSLIKSDLERIGITVDFVPIAFNTLIQKTDTRQWEAILLGFGGGGTEPNNGSNIWRSDGRLHLWNLGNQPENPAVGVQVSDWEREIDRIFIEAAREPDFQKRKELYNQFQTLVQEKLPIIGTVNPLVLTALRNRLQNVDPRPIVGALWNLEELSIAP